MRNLVRISMLCLALLVLASALPCSAGVSNPYSVLLDPGMTEFKVDGESFIVVTTQQIRISFAGVEPDHVWGSLLPSESSSQEQIKFMWLRDDSDPITLFFGAPLSHQWDFDSEDVTGHNEKFD